MILLLHFCHSFFCLKWFKKYEIISHFNIFLHQHKHIIFIVHGIRQILGHIVNLLIHMWMRYWLITAEIWFSFFFSNFDRSLKVCKITMRLFYSPIYLTLMDNYFNGVSGHLLDGIRLCFQFWIAKGLHEFRYAIC